MINDNALQCGLKVTTFSYALVISGKFIALLSDNTGEKKYLASLVHLKNMPPSHTHHFILCIMKWSIDWLQLYYNLQRQRHKHMLQSAVPVTIDQTFAYGSYTSF